MSASCRQMTGRRSARDGSAENPQTGRRRGDEEEGELRDAASVAGARLQKVRRKEAQARRTTGSERGPRESSSNGTGEAAGARRGPERRNGEETRRRDARPIHAASGGSGESRALEGTSRNPKTTQPPASRRRALSGCLAAQPQRAGEKQGQVQGRCCPWGAPRDCPPVPKRPLVSLG